MVQWLSLWASSVGGPGSTPGQGTRSLMPYEDLAQPNKYLKKKEAIKHLDPTVNLQEIQKTEKSVKLSFRYAVSKIQTVRNCRTDNLAPSFNKFRIKIAHRETYKRHIDQIDCDTLLVFWCKKCKNKIHWIFETFEAWMLNWDLILKNY